MQSLNGKYFHMRHCTSNRAELLRSKVAGCFHCKKIFDSQEIKDWVNDQRGETAVCPSCGIDSVYGDASGRAVNQENLSVLHDIWFQKSSTNL